MVEAATEVLGGKWKLVILRHLQDGTRRFGELHRAIPGVTARMLTRQLRELEADGLIERKVYAEVPPKVEYSLTPLGASLQPLLEAICQWSEQHLEEVEEARQDAGQAAFGCGVA